MAAGGVARSDEVMDLSPSSFGGPGSYFRIPLQWLLSDSEGACLRSPLSTDPSARGVRLTRWRQNR